MRIPQQSNTWVIRYWLWIAIIGFLFILIPYLILAASPALLLVCVCVFLAYKFDK